jgi:hypothetical protein
MESDDHGNPIYPRIPFLFSDPFSLDRLGYYSQLADQTNRVVVAESGGGSEELAERERLPEVRSPW